MTKKESNSHKKYMQKYNRGKWRERVEASGMLAEPAGAKTADWISFYAKLYTKLGLESYLPSVLNEIREAARFRALESLELTLARTQGTLKLQLNGKRCERLYSI